MASFQGNGGGLESNRGPQYRGALLPWEQQFCETLGIEEKDYFEYYDLVLQHIKEEQGRELIPDVRNEPVTVSIVLTVVGIALQVAAALLAPKPRAPEQKKQGDPFQSQDVRGRTKYAPLSEFDSVQDLAALGTVVPLIYCNREGGIGGVRAESQLIWSRMVNRQTYQELHALLLYSAGKLNTTPQYEGFAFGDTKITGHMAAKLAVFFSRGLTSPQNKSFAVGDKFQYSEGTKNIGPKGYNPFYTSVFDDGESARMVFCGTVTPSQAAVFGQYSPVRNGQGWKYEFKYPGKGDGDSDKRKLIFGTRRKHVSGYHAGRTNTTGSLDDLTFTIQDNDSDKSYQSAGSSTSNPDIETANHFDGSGKLIIQSVIKQGTDDAELVGGVEEGLTAINQSKIDADTILDVGELYLIGSDIYRCTDRKNDKGQQGTPYEPQESGNVVYKFKREQEFKLDWVDSKWIRVDDSEDIHREFHCPILKVSLGSINTTRPVNMVEIGFKSLVYRQINGYPNVSQFSYKDIADDYAKDQQTFQPGTIQAYYDRVSLFRMEVKKGDGSWKNLLGDDIFAVHGQNPQPLYNTIRMQMNEKDFYEFRFIPVSGNAWINTGWYQSKSVYWLNNRFDWAKAKGTIFGQIYFRGKEININNEFKMSHPLWQTSENVPRNQNPNSLLSDYWFFDSDTASHENEPEHQITWINEYVENSESWYNKPQKQYEHLAYAGLVCQSSKEISTFSNFSIYFREGLRVKRFVNANKFPQGATNNFPEIAYDLLTNRRYGVGEFIGNNAVDADRFNIAAEFCAANGFTWDGVISEQTNVREFLFQQAGYQLLDFTILGGQFSLYPSVPIDSNYTISFSAKAGDANFPIKALFTDGNVRNFKTTFLSPEERQLFIAELKYREEEENGFPQTRITRVRLTEKEGGYYRDPIEVFDMTQFCTSRQHAIDFAKFALRLRQVVDHSISFETTPDAAHTLAPGDYIRVAVSIQHQETDKGFTQRLRTGTISTRGEIQANATIPDGKIDIFYWRPGTTQVQSGKPEVKNGRIADTAFHHSLFTVKPKSEARIYKIESIAYSEESFIEINATYAPVTDKNTLRVLDWSSSDFVIEDQN